MGHKLQMYENLRDMLEKEVTGIEKKGDIDPQGLDNLYKLTAALKVVDKCIEREEGGASYANRRSYDRSYGSYDRSYDGMSNRMMPWAYDSYDSYEQGRSNARRGRDGDGDGRYNESRDNFRDSSYRGQGSYGDSYGRYSRDNAKKKMVEKLTTLMDDTMSEQERNAIMDCIEKIK